MYYHHVTVLLGRSKTLLKQKGPYEQISRVDCLKDIYKSNVVLLHLQTPTHFSRHCLPTFLPNRYHFMLNFSNKKYVTFDFNASQCSNVENNSFTDCIAIGHDKSGGLQKADLRRSPTPCFKEQACFIKDDYYDYQHKRLSCDESGTTNIQIQPI